MLKAIIFDWSGTLVDDMPPVLEATNAVLAHCGRPRMDRETYRREFCLPYTDFYERHAPGLSLMELDDIFRSAFTNSVADVTLLPYVREFLSHSRWLGHKHLVLSSALPEAVEGQARQFGLLNYLDAIYAGVLDKRLFIGEMLRRHGLRADQVLYLGDMVHDAETARHVGVKFIGLLTGYDHEPTLRKANPDLLAEDLSGVFTPLQRWNRTGKLEAA